MANVVSPIVIINKNTVRKSKINATPTKRALSSSSSSPNSPAHEDKKSKSFVSPNRFEVLRTEDEELDIADLPVSPSSVTLPNQNNLKLPNIVLKNVSDFTTLNNDLIRLVGSEGFTCKAKKSSLILRTNTRSQYLAIKSYLMDADYDFHCYKPRALQPFRVVLRHLHHSTDTENIINSLSDLGHKVISISNIHNRTSKSPLPLFNISLSRNSNNNDIFKITKLFNSIVKFEHPIRPLGPPQCHSCQMYGHTRNYCHHPPRCVKCGLSHLTKDCTKTREEPVKCANCDGNHTANYKGCQIFKNLLKRTIYKVAHKSDKVVKPKKHPSPPSAVPAAPQIFNVPSYNSNQKPTSYAKATANSSSVNQPLHIINKFIEDLKCILNPLLLALTSLINKITLPISSTP